MNAFGFLVSTDWLIGFGFCYMLVFVISIISFEYFLISASEALSALVSAFVDQEC